MILIPSNAFFIFLGFGCFNSPWIALNRGYPQVYMQDLYSNHFLIPSIKKYQLKLCPAIDDFNPIKCFFYFFGIWLLQFPLNSPESRVSASVYIYIYGLRYTYISSFTFFWPLNKEERPCDNKKSWITEKYLTLGMKLILVQCKMYVNGNNFENFALEKYWRKTKHPPPKRGWHLFVTLNRH